MLIINILKPEIYSSNHNFFSSNTSISQLYYILFVRLFMSLIELQTDYTRKQVKYSLFLLQAKSLKELNGNNCRGSNKGSNLNFSNTNTVPRKLMKYQALIILIERQTYLFRNIKRITELNKAVTNYSHFHRNSCFTSSYFISKIGEGKDDPQLFLQKLNIQLISQEISCAFLSKMIILYIFSQISMENFTLNRLRISLSLYKIFLLFKMEKVKELIKLGDFFNSFQMLRINKETEYRTYTGGIVSIGVIITIIIAFASMIGETLNRTTIDFTFNEQKGQDPPLTVLKASPEQNFMLALEVQGYNLSSENRIFDVVFFQFGTNNSFTLPTQACTREHWAMLPNIVEDFDRLDVGHWLCPAMNTQISLQGKLTSPLLHYFQLMLYPCNNDTDPSRPCAPQQQIDEFVSEFKLFTLYYVNSVINANQPQYKTYYLQDRNIVPFNAKKGTNIDLYVTEIQINSDNSIWPFEDNQIDTAISIPFSPIINSFQRNKGQFYVSICVMKDYAVQTYERKVQKIFVVFSFMGGLIGAIMACLFMMNAYTSFAYQLALATEVFSGEKDCKTYKKQFYGGGFSLNIFHFTKYIFYSILKKLKKNIKSPLYDHMTQCRNQILSQLDIKNLIKRIIFLEYSISFIFEDYQLAEMHEEKPTRPNQIKILRRKIQSQMQTEKDQLNQEDKTNKELKPQQQKKQINMNQMIQLPKSTHFNHIALEDSGSINERQVSNFTNKNKLVIYSQTQKPHRKMENIKKLHDSAKKGNIVSRKILKVINLKMDNISEKPSQKDYIQSPSYQDK